MPSQIEGDIPACYVMATGAYDNYWTRKQRELQAANKKLRTRRAEEAARVPVCPIPTKSGDQCKGRVTESGLCGPHQFYKEQMVVTDENVS